MLRSMAQTPDRAPLQPWERLVYSTSFTRFRLQFLENGGTNFCGGVRSSPLMTFSVCSLPSLAITKTVAASPSLPISGVEFSALGQSQKGSECRLPGCGYAAHCRPNFCFKYSSYSFFKAGSRGLG